MAIVCGEQVRLTQVEMAKIRKGAAGNGYAIQDIKTLEDWYDATLKMMDAETLAQVYQIYAEVAEEFNLSWPYDL